MKAAAAAALFPECHAAAAFFPEPHAAASPDWFGRCSASFGLSGREFWQSDFDEVSVANG